MQNNEKQKSTLIRDALALFLITLISGLSLSYIFAITKAPIELQQAEKRMKANRAVFEDADSFEKDEELMLLSSETDLASFDKAYEGITINEINQAKSSQGELLGYNLIVTTTQSYKDSITLVVGYSREGIIQGVEITKISETAGLGMKAAEPKFLEQYVNKDVEQFTVSKTGAATQDQIDAISGATITTKAVTNAVNAAIHFVDNYVEVGGAQ